MGIVESEIRALDALEVGRQRRWTRQLVVDELFDLETQRPVGTAFSADGGDRFPVHTSTARRACVMPRIDLGLRRKLRQFLKRGVELPSPATQFVVINVLEREIDPS